MKIEGCNGKIPRRTKSQKGIPKDETGKLVWKIIPISEIRKNKTKK
jgi:hypothetical protein